ncbi:MAG: AAA family ATPase [Rhodovibrionaceae bacterium]
MIYLVGGCSRSGKTTLARRLLAERGVPYFSTDYLARGLHGAGIGEVSPEEDDRITAAKLEPVLISLAAAAAYDRRDYLIEGVHLGPWQIRRILDRVAPPLAGCLLGCPEIDPAEKLAQLKARASGQGDWLMDFDAGAQLRFLQRQREISREQRGEADSARIPFFDSGADFDSALDQAFWTLSEQP